MLQQKPDWQRGWQLLRAKIHVMINKMESSPESFSSSEPNELPIKTILNHSLRFSSSALTSALLEPRLSNWRERKKSASFRNLK